MSGFSQRKEVRVMIYAIIGYIVFILIFLIFSASGIYHLKRYGYAGDLSRPVIILYTVVALCIIVSSLIFISTY